MVRLAFRTVDPEDLDYYERRLRQFSVPYDVIPEDYRRGRALRFTAPSGHTVELYNEMDYTGNVLPRSTRLRGRKVSRASPRRDWTTR